MDGEILHIYEPKDGKSEEKFNEKKPCCKKCVSNCDGNCCKKCHKGCGLNPNGCGMPEIPCCEDPLDLVSREIIKGLSKKDLMQLKKVLLEEEEYYGEGEEFKEVCEKAKQDLDKKSKTELILTDGTVFPIPRTDTRECIYVAAPSGSGKSTWSSKYIEQFQKLFPDRQFYLFSRVATDDILDQLNPVRMEINQNLVTDPIEPKELENSIVLFDDIDTIPDKKIAESVRKLRDDLLETGRHENVYTVSTSHQLMNYKHTRTLLNEASSVVFFPKSGSAYHIDRFLKLYCGLSRDQIKKIMNLPSRWVMINKTYPMYVLYETGAFLVGYSKNK